MSGLILAAVLALTPQSAYSGSADPRTEADFKCFGAALVLAGSADESNTELMNAAGLLGFYYLGRLEGREPDVDWPARGASIPDSQADAYLGELERCGAEFESKSQELISAGEAAARAS